VTEKKHLSGVKKVELLNVEGIVKVKVEANEGVFTFSFRRFDDAVCFKRLLEDRKAAAVVVDKEGYVCGFNYLFKKEGK